MVRHSRGSQQPSTSKKASDPMISNLKNLNLLDGPGLWPEDTKENPLELPTPDEVNSGFSDPVYLLAAVIFQNSHLMKPAAHQLVSYGRRMELPLPGVRDEASQQSAYELAFNTLRYQELLEDIMIDSCFYLSQPMPDDQMCLVAVMLYDLLDRKFLPREHQEMEVLKEVREVENVLFRFQTKLAAALARCKIKHNVLTIDCLLPEAVRQKQNRDKSLPLYAWVNNLKNSLEEVCSILKEGGFSRVNSVEQLKGQSYCHDPHCADMLVFPPQTKADLYRTQLLSDHKLIIQDKSCSMGPCSLRPLLHADGDVLMAGRTSGLTVSHAASLVAQGDAQGNSQSKVFVCVGDCSAGNREELQKVLSNMACKNVKLIPQSFLSLDPCDPRLQHVRLILLTPQCSLSAVSNPVEFILHENGDRDLLQDLAQGSMAQAKLDSLVAQQKKDICHALKFPKVEAVVYSTCSSNPEENEEVVTGALEDAGPTEESNLQPFRTSSFTPMDRGDETPGSPFFKLDPSELSNGCFLAVLIREPDPEVIESAQEVLARAAAKGLLDGIGSNRPTKKVRHGRQTRQAPVGISQARSAHTRPRANASSQSLIMEFLNREANGSSSTPTVPLAKGRVLLSGDAKPTRLYPQRPAKSTSYTSLYSTSNPAFSPSSRILTSTFNAAANPKGPSPTKPERTPAPPAAAWLRPLPQPLRGRQEVLHPVAVTLPPVLFPEHPQPAWQSRPQRSNRPLAHNPWKGPTPLEPLVKSSSSINGKSVIKHPRPWF
ncbi:hypothetical protein UPYG_G00215230 [Umbra pygmaea]|uniref:SAM-dependent MTase RsmB/NOP-type domain-containing protein n=1 Tax=Umbra pygmaea TaxID=75934 RepID=A0ABD0X8J9_UMBPY